MSLLRQAVRRWGLRPHQPDPEPGDLSGAGPLAAVSKKWFRVRETYGVEVEPGHDNALVLAIMAAIDQMTH